jgi:hypothetical protein
MGIDVVVTGKGVILFFDLLEYEGKCLIEMVYRF